MPKKDKDIGVAEGIVRGIQDAVVGRYRVVRPKMANVRALRRKLGMTQTEFALAYKIPVATIRSWEQEQREPDMATQAYLRVIAAHPQMVEKVLRS